VHGSSSQMKAQLKEMMYEECRVYHTEAPPHAEAIQKMHAAAEASQEPQGTLAAPPSEVGTESDMIPAAEGGGEMEGAMPMPVSATGESMPMST